MATPTTPTRALVQGNSHARSIDDFNRYMRSQPFYQAWFRARGLDPNNVHLSKDQRKELEGVLAAHGLPVGDMRIDPAANLNTPHGFSSQPKWVRALEIAAPIAASMLIPGVREAVLTHAGSLFGLGGTDASLGTGAGLTAAGNFSAANAASVVGGLGTTTGSALVAAAAPAAAKAGFSIADAFKTAFAPGLNAVTNLYGTRAQTQSNDRAAQIQADAINHAADLQAKAAEDALKFTKDEYYAREGRLAPYRRIGEEAMTRVGDLVRPGSGSSYLPPPTQYVPASALVRR